MGVSTRVRDFVVLLLSQALLIAAAPAFAQNAPPRPQSGDLKQASLEDLMQIEVTSASKKEQPFADAPSAIFVITQDDLARSGVTSIAEALRMVPGLEVARVDANKWAVSSRGFNGRFADKMLVLIDGRSVYTPLFSGVYWDVQETVLADIDRIEVIRGPGATLWGANAVNGVINIITRRASETHGALVSVLSGNDEHGVVEARYGAALGRSADARVFMKYLNRGPFDDAAGASSADKADQLRGGFRVDWNLSPDEGITLEGEMYSGSSGTTYGPGSLLPFYSTPTISTSNVGGGYALGRWTRAFSTESDVALQVYADRTTRGESALAGETRDTFDVDFQHHLAALRRQDLVWGVGVRTTADDISASPVARFTPQARRDHLASVFVQDELALVRNRLLLTGGVKLEHNSYTGLEVQPDVRVLVRGGRHTIWAAMSRAVRTPSRAENDIQISTQAAPVAGVPLPVVRTLQGSTAFVAETLRAHEVGYRVQPHARLSIDAAVFYNAYDHLRTFEPQPSSVLISGAGQPYINVPVLFANQMDGHSSGVELTARATPSATSRIDATYTFLQVDLAHKPGSADTLGLIIEDSSPRQQARVHGGVTVAKRLDLDASIGWVGRLENQLNAVGAYARVDGRAAWRLSPDVTLAAGVRNLLDDRHVEFISTLGELPTFTPRSAYVQIIWRR